VPEIERERAQRRRKRTNREGEAATLLRKKNNRRENSTHECRAGLLIYLVRRAGPGSSGTER